jgi:hypothetical protein
MEIQDVGNKFDKLTYLGLLVFFLASPSQAEGSSLRPHGQQSRLEK